MSNRCDICIEELCEGKKDLHNCNCDTCNVADKCNRILRPTIRITRKCTQSCKHCCFSCSPDCKEMMTVDMAKNVCKFLIAHDIKAINVMGGEFWLNPDWKEILSIFANTVYHMRIVTNGDWAVSNQVQDVLDFFYSGIHINVALSNDQWHTNENVEKAKQLMLDHDIIFKIQEPQEGKSESIVPIGRAEFEINFYSMFACYCHNPQNKYSFLIDEKGDIFKCSMGAWQYDNITNFLDGGFQKRFKEFNKKFYDCWISSCSSCLRAYHSRVV